MERLGAVTTAQHARPTFVLRCASVTGSTFLAEPFVAPRHQHGKGRNQVGIAAGTLVVQRHAAPVTRTEWFRTARWTFRVRAEALDAHGVC